jgi:hypothetical protein
MRSMYNRNFRISKMSARKQGKYHFQMLFQIYNHS